MAKIKLGVQPKNFKKVVTFQMLDGTFGTIEVNYKYRTRTEFGEFIDQLAESSGKSLEVETTEDLKFSVAKLMEETAGANAKYVMQAVDGWNLDEEFSHENVERLSNEIPAAIIAIMENYRVAITEGRLGN